MNYFKLNSCHIAFLLPLVVLIQSLFQSKAHSLILFHSKYAWNYSEITRTDHLSYMKCALFLQTYNHLRNRLTWYAIFIWESTFSSNLIQSKNLIVLLNFSFSSWGSMCFLSKCPQIYFWIVIAAMFLFCSILFLWKICLTNNEAFPSMIFTDF